MNELLSGMELNEMGDGSAMHEIGGQIQEYQSKLSEAMGTGDTESANYFRGQIEKLNAEMGTHQREAVSIGDENVGNIPGYNPEELRNAQSRLLSAKRELSTLESQRKGRTEDTELEKRIYKKKQEVEKLEREYKKAQYYNRPQIRGGDEGLGTHQGTEDGTELGTHQGSDGQEISFLGSDYSKMSKSELQSALSEQKRKSKQHADTAAHMTLENATTGIYNPKNLISDHLYSAKKAQEKVKEIESELKKR